MNFSRLSVLIVEDIGPMRQLLADILKTMGIGTVLAAANGREGYNKYLKSPPDIIITDWHMPELDGLQLIEKIRKAKDSPKRTIPIIMISGFSAPARVTKARDLGITEYLAKPFTVQGLVKRISYTISQPRDFILAPQFVGPDRRRRKDEDTKGKARREKDKKENPEKKKIPHKTIEAKKDLLIKVGKGQVDPKAISKSEKIMEETKVDFAPIARMFLNEFRKAIDDAEKEKVPSKKIKEDITFSVMQLKANARIFKYGLIGELSNTTLEFLESTTEIDDMIIEILNAQHKTLSHLVSTNTSGDGGNTGKSLKNELEEAYKRYRHAKDLRMQNALKAKTQEA